MTNNEMKSLIEKTVIAAMKEGQYIEIHDGSYTLSYVLVHHTDDDEYLFQGDEADIILNEAEAAAEKFNVSKEEYILYSSQSW